MGPFEAQIVTVVFSVLGAVTALGLVLRFAIRRREIEARDGDPELGPAVDALREDLHETQAQIAELQERLDFTERLLTAGRASRDQTEGG
jgi:hypothetical protein